MACRPFGNLSRQYPWIFDGRRDRARIRSAISRSGLGPRALRNDVRWPSGYLCVIVRRPGDARARRADAGTDRSANLDHYLFVGYLERHRELAEDQMRREIAAPTPLHAADLQFQAFAEFDCSRGTSGHSGPDPGADRRSRQLVSPQNSRFIASLIPGARLIVIPDCGHRHDVGGNRRMRWIGDRIPGQRFRRSIARTARFRMRWTINRILWMISSIFSTPALDMVTNWPWMLAGIGVDTMTVARQSVYFGGRAQFGDGKPVILVPQLGSNLQFLLLSNWLEDTRLSPRNHQSVCGFRRPIGLRIWCYGITKRVGRKAVLVASASGMRIATAIAETHRDLISDIVVLNASHHPDVPFGIRVHFIASGWSLWLAIAALPQVLRNIRIELIEEPGSVAPETVDRGASRLTCADPQPPDSGQPI